MQKGKGEGRKGKGEAQKGKGEAYQRRRERGDFRPDVAPEFSTITARSSCIASRIAAARRSSSPGRSASGMIPSRSRRSPSPTRRSAEPARRSRRVPPAGSSLDSITPHPSRAASLANQSPKRNRLGRSKFAGALTVLIRTARRAAEIIPLFERSLVDAARLAVLVDEQRLARRAVQGRRGQRRGRRMFAANCAGPGATRQR